MDKMCFLIAAHAKPEQFLRLVNALDYPHFDIFAHINLKADERLFYHPRVIFVKERIPCCWAHWTFTEAEINLLKTAYKHPQSYKYYSFITGQDYPIKSNEEIYSILSNSDKELINCTSNPMVHWHKRYQRYHFMKDNLRHKMAQQVFRVLNRILPPRKFPAGYTPYFGSSWWTLTEECAGYVLDVIEKEKKFCEFFRYATCVDEMFVHTIIGNSKFIKNTTDALRYIDWSERRSNPKVLKYPEDFDKICHSKAIFARKFDTNVDAVILDKIDEIIRVVK
jgi:hypothetical protein